MVVGDKQCLMAVSSIVGTLLDIVIDDLQPKNYLTEFTLQLPQRYSFTNQNFILFLRTECTTFAAMGICQVSFAKTVAHCSLRLASAFAIPLLLFLQCKLRNAH